MDDSRRQSATSSRLGMRHAAGEIVEVQGGHIVRSTGRKDRHSKVCTAKGPRDRRVRLSAHTAIQFYDVQDRLGYDRPSKAVDWLIKKAKPAIDELAELPPWNPQTVLATSKSSKQAKTSASKDGESAADGSRVRRRAVDVMDESEVHRNLLQQEMGDAQNNNSGYLPTSLVSDTIDDTIKSFFPIVAVTEAQPPATAIQFQSYPPDLLSRTSSQNQDLRLSLQSLQESPIMLHHQAAPSAQAGHGSEPVLFSGTLVALGGFDVASAGWEHHPQPAEMSRFQRMMSWNGGGADTGNGGSGGGGFVFGSPAQPQLQPVFGGHNSQLFSQRGPLQSSNTPSVRAWIDQSISATEEHHQIPQGIYHPQSGTSGIGFTSSGGFPRFRMPARIQGDEEEHDGIHSKPSSASFDSRH